MSASSFSRSGQGWAACRSLCAFAVVLMVCVCAPDAGVAVEKKPFSRRPLICAQSVTRSWRDGDWVAYVVARAIAAKIKPSASLDEYWDGKRSLQ